MNSIGYYESPIGWIRMEADNEALLYLNLVENLGKYSESNNKIIKQCCEELIEYFSGKRKSFDVPINPVGTDFQEQVWDELLKIPYGKTISYKQLAHNCNNPKGCRAVGTANGKNPIAIIVPCHRVIASDGTLGGYAYGLEVKNKLLVLEKAISPSIF